MAAVQMNTRIDSELKAQGDAAFAELGYSPSEAVRLLWGFAARNRHSRRTLANMLQQLKDPRSLTAEGQGADQKQASCQAWVEQWDSTLQRFFDATGCDRALYQSTTSDSLDDALGAIADENQERISLGLSREEYNRLLFERWKAQR